MTRSTPETSTPQTTTPQTTTPPTTVPGSAPTGFEDLLTANRRYAEAADVAGFDGIARAGVAMLTCMDSRIDPLAMIGLSHGDAKILRTPGGQLNAEALTGCVLAVHLLQVRRIMVVPHTRCAMASGTDDDLQTRIREQTGLDASDLHPGADPDQLGHLHADLESLRTHPLLRDRISSGAVQVGGFVYDVDTGLLEQVEA